MFNNMHCVENLLPVSCISKVSLTSQCDITKSAHPVSMPTILNCWHETKSYGGDQRTTNKKRIWIDVRCKQNAQGLTKHCVFKQTKEKILLKTQFLSELTVNRSSRDGLPVVNLIVIVLMSLKVQWGW